MLRKVLVFLHEFGKLTFLVFIEDVRWCVNDLGLYEGHNRWWWRSVQ